MRYFRIALDRYYLVIDNVKKPKYAGAFETYEAVYGDNVAYVKGILKKDYKEAFINKDDVSEFTEEDYLKAVEMTLN